MKVKILKSPQAANGLSLPENGEVENISQTGSPKDIIKFHGASHDDGGIPINYNNQNVEVEGQETGFVDDNQSMIILGNMVVPGTKTKFKTVGEQLARLEKKNKKKEDIGVRLTNEADPNNYYSSYAFNSGKVLMDGALQTENHLNKTKESLASLQQNMLDLAESTGQKPEKISKYFGGKAKFGIEIAKKGISVADDNILEEQKKMVKEHPELVKEALQKYGEPYAKKFDDGLNGKRTKYVRDYVQSKGLSTHPDRNFDPNYDPGIGNSNDMQPVPTSGPQQMLAKDWDLHPVPVQQLPTTPEYQDAPLIPDSQIPTYGNTSATVSKVHGYKNRLGLSDIAPELLAMADRQQPVPGQYYSPNLLSGYKVSYEDELASNQGDYNAIQRATLNNPAALGALNASKYDTNNKIYGQQFRENQGIESNVMNANNQMLNEAAKMNLGFNDLQMQRQAQAYENTRANRQSALASLSQKEAQVRSENATDKLYSDYFRYTYDPKTGYHVDPNRTIDLPGEAIPITNTQADQKEKTTKKTKYSQKNGTEQEVSDTTTKRMGGRIATRKKKQVS